MAGYPSRTPGELGGLTDRVETLEKQLRRVLSPTAEQYAQAVASLKVLVDDVAKAASTAQGAADKAQATADALPIITADEGSRTGTGGTGSSGQWNTYVDYYINNPASKKNAQGQVVAQAVMVDMTSGGGATLSMRIVVDYASGYQYISPAFQAAKNAGASAVNNVVNGSAIVNSGAAGSRIRIRVQCAQTNPGAFPNNNGNLVQSSTLAAWS